MSRKFSALCVLLILCTSIRTAEVLANERLSFTVPTAPWNLTLPKGGLIVERKQIKPDGRSGYFSMTDKTNNLTISFFIEPATKCKDSKSCRDLIWKSGNPSWENPQNVVQSEVGEVSVFEFFMPSFRGMPVKQQHMYAQFVKDEFWVDMHLSKVLYTPREHKLFEDVIKSVQFEPKVTSPQRRP